MNHDQFDSDEDIEDIRNAAQQQFKSYFKKRFIILTLLCIGVLLLILLIYEVKRDVSQDINRDEIYQELITGENQSISEMPKKVWRFHSKEKSIVEQLMIKNIKHFSDKGGFQFMKIQRESKSISHLSKSSQKIIESLLSQSYLKRSYNAYKAFRALLTQLFTLRELGGIWMHQNFIFYEPPNWLLDLDNDIFVINKHKQIKPQFFTFYDTIPFPSTIMQENLSEFNPTPKYLNTSLIASVPHSKLINKWIIQFLKREEKYANSMVEYLQYPTKVPQEQDYNRLLQQSFDFLMEPSPEMDGVYPVHYYGLRQMYYYFHTNKLRGKAYNLQGEEFYLMTQYTIEEIQFRKGPLRYVQDLNMTVMQRIQEEIKYKTLTMDQKCILNEFLYMNQTDQFFIKSKFTKEELEEEQRLIKQQTFDFPKIVWLYWDKGVQSMDFWHKLCYHNIEYYVNKSNYKLILATDANYHQYISKESYDHINEQMVTLHLRPQRKSDLVRHAIIYQNGGIYMDETIMLTEPLNWLQTIHHQKFTMGRTSKKKPQVFVFYNRLHTLKNTVHDKNLKHKLMVSPGLESGFIVAVPKAKFIAESIKMHDFLITQQLDQVQAYCRGRNVNVTMPIRIQPYLYIMVAYQIVVQVKQQELDTNPHKQREYALHHYGIVTEDTTASYYQVVDNIVSTEPFPEFRNLFHQRTIQYYTELFGQLRRLLKFHGSATYYFHPDFDKYKENGYTGFNAGSLAVKYLVGLEGAPK